MFLLVPAHPGCPGQNPESCKMVVCGVWCVCVMYIFNDILVITVQLYDHCCLISNINNMYMLSFVLYITEIQEFYEVTLLDSNKTLQEKTAETLQIASKWEQNPPISEPKPVCVTDFSSSVTEQPQLFSESCVTAEVILLMVEITFNLCRVLDILL